MHLSRLQAHFETYRLPQPPDPPVSPAAFVWFPMTFSQQMPLALWLYQLAFEQARAVARPSLLERDLLAVWN